MNVRVCSRLALHARVRLRSAAAASLVLTFGLGAARGQQTVESKRMLADAHPVFEVAAIRRSNPDHRSSGFHMNGRHFTIENQSVARMLLFAFGLSKSQIVGAPDWVDSERFDVDGVPDLEGEASRSQAQEMVRKLLMDRFALKMHTEQRELPVYALTVAKGGPKLKETQSAPDALPDERARTNAGIRDISWANNSIDEFALAMQFEVTRPVLNKTGLEGKWDFELKWTYDDTRLTEPNAPPGLFTAVQEQLGLKLDAVKAPVAVMVVDTVERPSEN